MAIIVIPARLASQRLPNKLLLDDTGKPLICHAIDRALESRLADYVYVASEDFEILTVVAERYPGKVITCHTPKCGSGTDRISWLVDNLDYNPKIVVNLQGDEPELSGEHLDDLIRSLDDSIIDVATIASPITGRHEYMSPNVVKVVLDHNSNAMYFSRCPIPFKSMWRPNPHTDPIESLALKHIGVYAYKYEFLLVLKNLKPTTLDSESLEQLQWLQSGFRIKVLKKDIEATGIDTLQEYQKFVQKWQEEQKSQQSL